MDDNTYVQILISILTKKNVLLEQLIQNSSLQEKCITNEIPDMEQFDNTISEKEPIIHQINQLDDGFDKIYDHVSDELKGNKVQYKEDILKLQELIKGITDKSIRLQALEKSNKEKLEVFFSTKKREIKNLKFSSNTVSNYYKNMANQHQGQSYFVDKKR